MRHLSGATETTVPKQLKPWKKSQSGNPAGRPKGARNKLSETFLQALADDFDSHGKDVIEKVRADRPHDYLKVIAAVLPKRMEIEDAAPTRRASDLTDDELAGIIERANGSEKTSRGRQLD
jgi:Family of unknown function (DUF5681)